MYHLNYAAVWRDLDLLLAGLRLAIEMAVIALSLGSVIGLMTALMRTCAYRPLRALVVGYVELVRNIPLLLILFIVYFGFPTIGIYWLDERQSAIFALTFYSGAYLSEILRHLESVSRHQIEAAKAIGLNSRQVILYVVLPITIRVVLPSMGNVLISLFKDTSLATSIAVRELTHMGVTINVKTWRVVEVWSIVALMYVGTSVLLSLGLRLLERRLAIPK